jgi:hypothetical protein
MFANFLAKSLDVAEQSFLIGWVHGCLHRLERQIVVAAASSRRHCQRRLEAAATGHG